ncbi:MAG TPA: DUF6134 family protein [Planctomycetaceae bacterium]|jgi:hypothetical protein
MKHHRDSRLLQNKIWITLTLAFCAWTTAGAAEPKNLERETREFKVSVDGKPRGKCTMQIHHRNDGSDKMSIDAGLSFDFVVYKYRYHSTGTEIWKNDRLLELENTSDFNGTKYVLKAVSGSNGLFSTVNGKKSQLAADAWVTSYWRLPEHLMAKNAPQSVSLLDSDKGQHLHGKLTYVGDETITVAGKRRSCVHYRIAGDVRVELWYDAARRLVRQESVDDGHKTLLELTRIAAE